MNRLARSVAGQLLERRGYCAANNPVMSQRPTLVVFNLDGQRWGLDLAAVERAVPMVQIAPLPQAPAIALGVINVHRTVIPVLDIRARLGLPPRTYGASTHLLLARTSRRTVALPVDEVTGVLEVTDAEVTPPDAVLPGIGHVAGVVALTDGVLLIQDLDAFLSIEEDRHLSHALQTGEE